MFFEKKTKFILRLHKKFLTLTKKYGVGVVLVEGFYLIIYSLFKVKIFKIYQYKCDGIKNIIESSYQLKVIDFYNKNKISNKIVRGLSELGIDLPSDIADPLIYMLIENDEVLSLCRVIKGNSVVAISDPDICIKIRNNADFIKGVLTSDANRSKGFGAELIRRVRSDLCSKKGRYIYCHIEQGNMASKRVFVKNRFIGIGKFMVRNNKVLYQDVVVRNNEHLVLIV